MARTKDTKNTQEKVYIATGRRKTAVARVFLYPTKGEFTVNGLSFEDYFNTLAAGSNWQKPFHVLGLSHPTTSYSATIKVEGSGKPSQFDAVLLGLSRALVQIDEENRLTLRKFGLLTRDPREVERKKYYLRKARKSPQYSKR